MTKITEDMTELIGNTPMVKIDSVQVVKKLNEECIKHLDKTLSPAVALSLSYFRNGLYCSEAILRAFNEVYQLGFPETFYKISTAFGAGLGEAKCICGSVAGGVMVLSLIAGRNINNESERLAFTLTHELHNHFKAKHDALCCRVLTRNVLWHSAEHKIQCEKYVIDAAQITDGLIKKSLCAHVPQLDSLFLKYVDGDTSILKIGKMEGVTV